MASIATAIATPNIAFVKYWGNRNERLILPAGGSLSMTLDRTFTTKTTAYFSEKLKKDELVLNGKKVSPLDAPRIAAHVDVMRHAGRSKMHCRIESMNNFPTSAGIASSASGFAALTLACAKALGIRKNMQELSALARLGSGSATRSFFGGFVEWMKGERKDGKDSFARQVAPAAHWKELRDVVAVVSEERKHLSSRDAMRITIKTSRLFKERMESQPVMLSRMREAILEKDAQALFAGIMAESDSMHACMADSRPPIVYMNGTSRKIVQAVDALNDGGLICGYTFDAGPNAHVITTAGKVGAVKKALAEVEGVRKMMVSGVGSGPEYSQKHLFRI
jgi:diphosphomevalonate decarboxylase